MDYCTISYHRPEPLVCQGEGRARLDAWDGRRRLLGELVFQAPVTLHFVEVEAVRRSWLGQDRALYAVTVCNRSSLPLDRVEVVPDGAIEPGSLRIEGRTAEEPVLPGLAAGGQALLTWREPAGGASQSIGLRYRYTFAGEVREGVCTL